MVCGEGDVARAGVEEVRRITEGRMGACGRMGVSACGSRTRWVRFVKKFCAADGEKGEFEAAGGDLASFGGCRWLRFAGRSVCCLWFVVCGVFLSVGTGRPGPGGKKDCGETIRRCGNSGCEFGRRKRGIKPGEKRYKTGVK